MRSEFEEIAREALHRAQGVQCPFPEYVEGLRRMVEMLHDELQMVESEEGAR